MIRLTQGSPEGILVPEQNSSRTGIGEWIGGEVRGSRAYSGDGAPGPGSRLMSEQELSLGGGRRSQAAEAGTPQTGPRPGAGRDGVWAGPPGLPLLHGVGPKGKRRPPPGLL